LLTVLATGMNVNTNPLGTPLQRHERSKAQCEESLRADGLEIRMQNRSNRPTERRDTGEQQIEQSQPGTEAGDRDRNGEPRKRRDPPSHRLQEEPAEGSREVINRELARRRSSG
jgi:hypothetical protein